MGLALTLAAGPAALAVGTVAGALVGFVVDRARPGAIRRALGTARGSVEVRVGRDGVLMNGRYLSWTAQRLDPGSVSVAPGEPAVLHLAAHALADDGRVPVAYQLPVPAERAESAAAALRVLARGR